MKSLPNALACLAALMGASGVALAAASAHGGGNELGRTASEFLLIHAAALLGVSAHARVALSARAPLAVGLLLGLGAILFAADLASRAFLGDRLFPFAAPIGGSTMILGWVGLAVVSAVVR